MAARTTRIRVGVDYGGAYRLVSAALAAPAGKVGGEAALGLV
jgi:hypothetical protein